MSWGTGGGGPTSEPLCCHQRSPHSRPWSPEVRALGPALSAKRAIRPGWASEELAFPEREAGSRQDRPSRGGGSDADALEERGSPVTLPAGFAAAPREATLSTCPARRSSKEHGGKGSKDQRRGRGGTRSPSCRPLRFLGGVFPRGPPRQGSRPSSSRLGLACSVHRSLFTGRQALGAHGGPPPLPQPCPTCHS